MLLVSSNFRHAGSEIACCAGDLEDLEGVLLTLVLLGHQGDIYIGEDPSIPQLHRERVFSCAFIAFIR